MLLNHCLKILPNNMKGTREIRRIKRGTISAYKRAEIEYAIESKSLALGSKR